MNASTQNIDLPQLYAKYAATQNISQVARDFGISRFQVIEVRDTLVQVLHRVPRFKLLGIWFGTKGIRQEIVSKNPHTRIVAAEYIQITK